MAKAVTTAAITASTAMVNTGMGTLFQLESPGRNHADTL
jgi:hypothetical protein